MALLEERIVDGEIVTYDRVAIAIERLKTFAPANEEPYFLAFSGGKDSQCIYHLAVEAGVPFEAHYQITTLDPPELVQFIKKQYPTVKRDQPALSMWRLIEKKGILPLRHKRYCCSELKECGGAGRVVITGVRWAESTNRAGKRNGVELNSYSSREQKFFFDNDNAAKMYRICPIEGRHIINPIIDWSEADVWEFIRSRGLEYCKLYDEGRHRLGCICCPCAPELQRRADLARWPTYRTAYLHVIKRLQAKKKLKPGMSPEEVLEWWILGRESVEPPIAGQEVFDVNG